MLFVVGDIHGQFYMLEKLLTKWNPDVHQLVFIGDYIDRGENSLDVLRLVYQLVREYGAVAIGGNHESMFLQWLDHPEDELFLQWMEDPHDFDDLSISTSIMYYANGGDRTIDSFYNAPMAYKRLPTCHAGYIKEKFFEEIEFIRNMPNYFEWGDYVCVHAGVDLSISNWRNTSNKDFRWIRHPFHYGFNRTGKTFIFGHTPTLLLNWHIKPGSHDVWVSPCGTKIGIDGGAVFGGLLHGVVVGDDRLVVHSVSSDGEFVQKEMALEGRCHASENHSTVVRAWIRSILGRGLRPR